MKAAPPTTTTRTAAAIVASTPRFVLGTPGRNANAQQSSHASQCVHGAVPWLGPRGRGYWSAHGVRCSGRAAEERDADGHGHEPYDLAGAGERCRGDVFAEHELADHDCDEW